MANDKIRISLDVSPELNDLLGTLAEKIGGTKSEVLRKAITLIDLAVDANEHGKKLMIAEPDEITKTDRLTEIVGLVGPRTRKKNK